MAASTPLALGGVVGDARARAQHWRAEPHRIDSEVLRRFADRHGLRSETLVYGAWAVLLSRYSGEREVVFGIASPHSPWPRRLRLDVDPDASVLDWLAVVKAAVAEVGAQNGRSGDEASFETVVAIAESTTAGVVGGDAQAEAPLVVTAVVGHRLRFHARYHRGRLETRAVDRLLGHFERLMAEAVTDADRPVGRLPWLSEGERRQVLVDWNDTAADFPRTTPLHALVEAQARRAPQADAVIDERVAISYGDLDARANRVARHLVALGVGPEVVVGVCLERSAEMVVALLGILKAGGAYLPLDPEFPADRLELMLDDSAAPVLVTQRSLLELLPSTSARAICLDADHQQIACRPPTAPEPSFHPDQLAYVIYTSGSTGRPKGVQVTHANMTNFLTTMAERPGLTEHDVLVAVTTLSFDIAGLELYLPLTIGAKVVVASSDTAAEPGRLARLIEDCGATVVQATPATWRMLVDDGWRGVPGLKALCGGDALPVALADELLARGLELWNMYGPTETTVWSTVVRVDLGRAPTIGRPIANTTVYVLDQSQEPVPVGVAGELHIGGAGVARGYLHRPELTAERFVPDPFGPTPGGRLYKTGDLGRWREDGTLEFLGRLDNQVKVRGFRIELGEIETALDAHPSVRATAVVAPADPGGDRRLVAYLVPEGAPPSVPQLRRHLESRVPSYMVPSLFVLLDALPLTPNGKVDRKALMAPEMARAEAALAYVPARTPTEQVLAAIWTEVLGVDRVGVEDDFFELGGHSLLAAHVVSCVRERLGARLELRSLYEAPTVAELATVVAACEVGDEEPPLVALDRASFVP